MLINILMRCHCRINDSSDSLEMGDQLRKDATGLVEGVISSIPYLLAADLQAFVENAMVGSPPFAAGRPVGGLLSMHTLFVLSTLPLTEERLKAYLKNCLAWIGIHMGIGQATILSKVRY